MKLLVTGPSYFIDELTFKRKCWLYLRSAYKFGVNPQTYGIGSDHYYGETVMRMTGLVEFLRQQAGYTHVLFSDIWDVMFTRRMVDVVDRYKLAGSPECLCAGSFQCYNLHPKNLHDEHFNVSEVYRYPSCANFIAEIPYIIDRFSRMNKTKTHDQTPAFIEAWISGLFRPEIDFRCEIFQDKTDNCEVVNGELHNTLTGSYPCMVHISGGPMDQDTGRDYAMKPWAEKLGIVDHE